jgi:hypothetical protein
MELVVLTVRKVGSWAAASSASTASKQAGRRCGLKVSHVYTFMSAMLLPLPCQMLGPDN